MSSFWKLKDLDTFSVLVEKSLHPGLSWECNILAIILVTVWDPSISVKLSLRSIDPPGLVFTPVSNHRVVSLVDASQTLLNLFDKRTLLLPPLERVRQPCLFSTLELLKFQCE